MGAYIYGITVFKIFIWAGIASNIRTEILWFQNVYIRRYTSPNENFEYGYPDSNTLLTFLLQKDSENVLCFAYVQRLPAA